MIVYLKDKRRFRQDILSNQIDSQIKASLSHATGRNVGEAEVRAWQNSLRYMDNVIEDPAIPEDAGIAIEFNIPGTAKRVDFIITGYRPDRKRSAVIVELKQWEKAEKTPKDAVVRTFVGKNEREVSHPSYQAWSYATLIEDTNETVRSEPIHLHPCAYLHNCVSRGDILHKDYQEHIQKAPAYLKGDAIQLREFIKKYIGDGDSGEAMYLIQDGKISPSRSLADHLVSLLQGNKEFVLIDEQKVVYETARQLALTSSPNNKNVLIVHGGPGTGKSVVAINLLVELINQGLLAHYVTRNSAPRDVYASILQGHFKKSRINHLFKGSGAYFASDPNTFRALIVDEAHRLNEKSGMFYHQGEHQVKEIIQASCFSVFFIDEAQRIHWKDIGNSQTIREKAEELGATITTLELTSQFRCNGSDGYLAWVDNTLGIRPTAHSTMEAVDYDLIVCDSANELRDRIYAKNSINGKARMVAGYCWKWKSKKNKNAYDIVLPSENFSAQWNLEKHGMLWILEPESVKEVGCIHTCQGLELDYVGVILGPDFLIRNGEIVTDASKRDSGDRSIAGYKSFLRADPIHARQKADEIIKNTYRTLMTRGQKGCFLYSVDKETNEYLKNAARRSHEANTTPQSSEPSYPFRIVSEEELKPYENALPLFDAKIVAGNFSEEQWVDSCAWVVPPEHIRIVPGYFIAQVVGESMNRRIPNGSWCLFRSNPVGSREGITVLVQHRDIQDPAYQASFTIKVYHSQKRYANDGTWEHTSIWLSPDSTHPGYQPIELSNNALDELRVIGEFVAVL